MAEPNEEKVPGWQGGKPLMTEGAARLMKWFFLVPIILFLAAIVFVALTR